MQRDDNATRFLDISPYISPPSDLQAPLSADLQVEVAIVGGGYTGLSTALALNDGMPDGHYARFGGEDLPGFPTVWQERIIP